MSNYPPGCANKYIDDYTLDARERMAKWLLNRARERVWRMADYNLFR
jgi:hypothetical protein